MSHRTSDRHIRELLARRSAAKEQPTATHIAAADECIWKKETITEDRLQHVNVLRRGDAAEEHDRALDPDVSRERACAPLERTPVLRVVDRHVDACETLDR